jgi:alkylation response protein AidB-like acyl-CoA dehydrogenase
MYTMGTLLRHGSEQQKQRFLPGIADGSLRLQAFGVTEPSSGTDTTALRTSARRDSDHYIVNGQKIWTSTAQFSQMCFCLVRTEPDAPKHAGISYLLIPMDTPGIEIRPLVDMTLKPGFNEVFFTDVKIPEGNIIGKRGEGWAVANATLGHERGSLAPPDATMNRVNMLIHLMKKETLDGKPLIEHPIYRDRLMQIQGKVLAQQSHALRLLSAKLNPGTDVKIGKMIQKLTGTELRHELEGLAIDVMGEIGTLYEDSPHLKNDGTWQFIYMYFLGLIIGGGTSQIQKNIIAERGLGMPKEPKIQGA